MIIQINVLQHIGYIIWTTTAHLLASRHIFTHANSHAMVWLPARPTCICGKLLQAASSLPVIQAASAGPVVTNISSFSSFPYISSVGIKKQPPISTINFQLFHFLLTRFRFSLLLFPSKSYAAFLCLFPYRCCFQNFSWYSFDFWHISSSSSSHFLLDYFRR